MVRFLLAGLVPALFLCAACILGGIWPALAVASITVLVFAMDRLTRLIPDTQTNYPETFVTFLLAATHFALWTGCLWTLCHGAHLSLLDKVFIAIGAGLYFGQISNSNAHEMIHAPGRGSRRIGTAVYCSLLFGHHVSAHRLVHHKYAGTAMDPNTARYGEGFWRYLFRAWTQEVTFGKRAEDHLRQTRPRGTPRGVHPYVWYTLGGIAALTGAILIGGIKGVALLFVLAFYAQIQLYLSDYVQHYGLMRRIEPNGRAEPVGPQHSWNAPHWYSGAMMLNAPRHSDHHTNPTRPFPQLKHDPQTMPTLPHSLPTMAVVALIPPLWRKIMNRRTKKWAAPGHIPAR